MDRLPRLTLILSLFALIAIGAVIALVASSEGSDGSTRLVIAPCMTLEEVEERSEGFDADDHRDERGFADPLAVGKWQQIDILLGEDDFISFRRGVGSFDLDAGLVSLIRPGMEDLPMEDWGRLEKLVAELELRGFSTAQDEKRRLLDRQAPTISRHISLVKGSLKFDILVSALGSHYELYVSVGTVAGCR
ncbi:MAG TPA: hypothetical protein PK095_00575 [Myxococcota bacterium]|nr:hypothetical protein [Myxococcota bacterium]